MESYPADKSAVSDAQARRVLALRRVYQRELGRKPTTIQKSLIDRAATMTAKAEAAALDSAVTANDCVRLDNAASKARAAMFDSFKVRAATAGPSLPRSLSSDALMARHKAPAA
jgi:hypothetical protein